MGLKKRIGRPPNPEAPPTPALWESPGIDKQVDEILTALDMPKIDAETRGIFQRMIYRQKYFGGDPKGRIIFIIRAITESNGNEGALIGPVVRAVSSALKPEWMARGLGAIEAFDQVPLMTLLATLRELFGERDAGQHLETVIRRKLFAILRPANAKPAKVKLPPKPPLAVTRVPQIERAIALGKALLALRETISCNKKFGREVRKRFPDVDTITVSRTMRVARLYSGRPEVWRAASWRTLIELASPKMAPSMRRKFEARILAGESITAPHIRKIRGRFKGGSPKRPADQPARMAA